MTVNIVEILDLYLKNGGRRPYIIIVLNSCFIPKTFRTFPGFFPIFHRYNKNQDFFRNGNGFYEMPDFFPFSRLRGNPVVTGIFSSSHNVFYPSQNKFQIFCHFYFVVCKCFRFGQTSNFVIW